MSKLKEHFVRNKTAYLVSCAVVGTAGITYLIMRRQTSLPISDGISVRAQNGISVLGKKVVMNDVSYISNSRKGPPSWVVRCKETGAIFESQKKAAKVMDIPSSELSKQLNGLMENVRGFTFERICMSA